MKEIILARLYIAAPDVSVRRVSSPPAKSVNLADRAMSNCFESVIRNEPSEPLIQR
jgi:hypothetical protein